jgi:hypothetical protein
MEPQTPPRIMMGTQTVDQNDITTPSPSGNGLQSSKLRTDPSPLTLGGLHNSSPQPPKVFAKTPTSSSIIHRSPTPNFSSSAGREQTGELEQNMSNLTFEEVGSPASIVTSEDNASRPYNINDEPAPNEPFYSPQFQSMLQEGIKIAGDVTDGLIELRSFASNQGLSNLQENAETLKNYQNSGTRTIAVLGDSGQGE